MRLAPARLELTTNLTTFPSVSTKGIARFLICQA